MRLTLSCVLAIGFLVASTGCHLTPRQASTDMGSADAAGYWGQAPCADGNCQTAGVPTDGAYCGDVAVCGDGSCGSCGRCLAMLQGLGQRMGRGCRGLNCGVAEGPTNSSCQLSVVSRAALGLLRKQSSVFGRAASGPPFQFSVSIVGLRPALPFQFSGRGGKP